MSGWKDLRPAGDTEAARDVQWDDLGPNLLVTGWLCSSQLPSPGFTLSFCKTGLWDSCLRAER